MPSFCPDSSKVKSSIMYKEQPENFKEFHQYSFLLDFVVLVGQNLHLGWNISDILAVAQHDKPFGFHGTAQSSPPFSSFPKHGGEKDYIY